MSNILITASTFPRWEGDAVPPFVYHLASGLADKEHRVHVLAPHTKGAAVNEKLGNVEVHRFRYAAAPMESLCYDGGILQNLKHRPTKWCLVPPFMASELYALTHLVRKHRIELINAHWFLPQGLVAALGSPWLRRPLIITGHGGDIFASRGRARKTLVKFAAQKATTCTVNSAAMSSELRSIASVEPVVIPMGVDIARFAYSPLGERQPCMPEGQGPNILFVGRLVEKKGARYLLQAMPKVLAEKPHAILTVVGDGPEMPDLRSLAKQLGIDSRVCFEGSVPNEKLGEYYQRADMFIAPSIRDQAGDTEALGVVALEAAASGTPIVATNVGGIPDIVTDNVTGLLVDEANADQLATAILRLADDPALGQRLAFQARSWVEGKFSWGSVVDQFDGLVRGVLDPTLPN